MQDSLKALAMRRMGSLSTRGMAAGDKVVLRLGEGGHPRAQLLGGQLPGKDLPDVRDDLLQRARPLRKVVAGFDDAEKLRAVSDWK